MLTKQDLKAFEDLDAYRHKYRASEWVAQLKILMPSDSYNDKNTNNLVKIASKLAQVPIFSPFILTVHIGPMYIICVCTVSYTMCICVCVFTRVCNFVMKCQFSLYLFGVTLRGDLQLVVGRWCSCCYLLRREGVFVCKRAVAGGHDVTERLRCIKVLVTCNTHIDLVFLFLIMHSCTK